MTKRKKFAYINKISVDLKFLIKQQVKAKASFI